MDRREHFNEEPGISGEMSVEFDTASGYIRSYGSGFWSPRQATAFFEDWCQIIAGVHAAGASVSALVDMSESAIQLGEVTAIIASATIDLYRPGDAIAMLVPNSLAKMQMRRILPGAYHEFFLSRHAADQWLYGRARRDRATLA